MYKTKRKPNYPKQYDVFRLKDPQIKSNCEVEIGGRFAPLLSLPDTDTLTMWEEVKTAFSETSKKILGSRKANPNKPWISEEVINLANERSKAKQAKLQDPTKKSRYNYLSREIKRKAKGCKDTWIKSLCAKSRQGTPSSKIKGSILNNKDYHKEANHKNANNQRKGWENLDRTRGSQKKMERKL